MDLTVRWAQAKCDMLSTYVDMIMRWAGAQCDMTASWPDMPEQEMDAIRMRHASTVGVTMGWAQTKCGMFNGWVQ